jgi:hypothetical protein
MDLAFESGDIWDSPEDDMREFLSILNKQGIPNERVQHRAIIRALTINHIQMQRILAAQDKSNRITQFWFMVLAVGGLIASVVAIFF